MTEQEFDFVGPHPPATPLAPFVGVPDKARVSAYYENGELTNIDVTLNHDDITNEDIEKLVAILRVRRRPTVVTGGGGGWGGGGGTVTFDVNAR